MKNLLIFVFAVLLVVLVQVSAETSSFATDAANSSADLVGGSHDVALYKKHHYHHRKINCSYACSRRCRKASRMKVCKRACKTCCNRCKCVPPGTYGNKGSCPCYAKLKTHGNKLKCP